MGKQLFSAADFGAMPNKADYQDEYIQKAIDACFLAGGGEVVIPSGTYPIRGLRLRSNTTLHLLKDCVLEASRDPEDYFILDNDTVEPVDPSEIDHAEWHSVSEDPNLPFFRTKGSRWNNAIIRIYDAHNVAIIGEEGSVIDGKNSYDPLGEEHYRGVHGISVMNSRHITFSGYTIRNTGNWAHCITGSYDIRMDGVVCLAGHDGIHTTSCEDIIVRRSEFYTGDDCIAGFNNKNVLVTDCEINTACSAFRFGGTNVLVTDCHIFAPAKYFFRGALTAEEKADGILANDAPSMEKYKRDNMLSVFTYYADYSVDIVNLGTNIIIRDCEIDGADRFLHFNYSGNETWQNNKPMLDIKFMNINAKNIKMPLCAYGDKNSPVTVKLENIDFRFREGFEDTAFIKAANFNEISLENVKIENCTAENLILIWSKPGEGKIAFNGLECGVPEEKLIGYPTEEFYAQPI